ncbi:MAG: type II secretion system protein GspG [Candidatus Liptonbacteria bacterium]|nr:type II secretion system protein GspG [Candidatus Liptonbacteria bacterium]
MRNIAGRRASNDVLLAVDLDQIQKALDIYSSKFGRYPDTLQEGLGALDDKTSRGNKYEYAPNPDKTDYVLGTVFDDATISLLKTDSDGIIYGVDCNDPVYCVTGGK